MKKIPEVKQRDFKDCGVCSMLSIIKYYGGFISLEKLRVETNTNNEGTNALQIVNCFKKYGFDSIGLKLEDNNWDNIKLPAIVQMTLKNGLNHFAVVYEITSKKITLMDPGVGKKVMTLNEFNEIFTGYVILAIPKSDQIIKEKEVSIISLFWNISQKEKKLIFKIILTSIIVTILTVILSYYFKVCSNVIGSSVSIEVLKLVIISFLSFNLLKIFLEYIRAHFENILNTKVDTYIYRDFFNHLFHLPLNIVKSRSTGEIITRVDEIASIKELFSEIFISTLLDLLLAIASMIVLYIINSKLFLILWIFIISYLLFGIIVSKVIYKKIMRNINLQTDFNTSLVDNINMFESIKNLNITHLRLQEIEYILSRFLNDTYNFVKHFNKISIVKSSILDLGLFIINSVGFYLIYKGEFSFINLVTFNMLINYAINPLKNIVDILPKFNYIKASFSKIAEFYSIEEEDDTVSNLDLSGDILFKEVDFTYDNIHEICHKVTFTIKKGEHVFLKGESGCGKSTVCNLLYKNFIPTHGEILINNINILDIGYKTIRDKILYLSQSEELFLGSVKENIIIGRNITDNLFNDICQICHIEDIIKKKPLRYNSLIDPMSKNLSGGEKQRIILARGLLKASDIIIIDEALSEVDDELEKKIISNILDYFRDKTIIYISHKDQSAYFNKTIDLGAKHEKLLSL